MMQMFDEIFVEFTRDEREALNYIIRKQVDEIESQTLKDTPLMLWQHKSSTMKS